ncbi:MAG: putative baseplate assembly protein [Nocardioidaceae bacterium]
MNAAAQTSYTCAEDLRPEAVRDASTVNGIDYLEVLAGQTTLEVHFLHPLPGQADAVPTGGTVLDHTHVRIEGGDRVRGIRVVSLSTSADILTITVSGPGDFSTYCLRLVDPVSGETPTGFDPRLSAVDFSFKAGCPIRFDCLPSDASPAAVDTSQVRDYLAKDYDSFRQLMLDRLATTLPDWTERNPADLQVALVELLAFAADRLSYEQDAVATEAYLRTARRRVSVRRHARLLGYRMHEGSAARAFVQIQVTSDRFVEAGRQFLTGDHDDAETLVFESLHDLTATADHNEIDLYTWTDDECVLPTGATRATLSGATSLTFVPGDLLLFEEIAGASSGAQADQDRSHRHVVRLTEVTPDTDPLDATPVVEVAWAAEDAMPFDFRVSALTTASDGTRERSVIGVARGNVVLVEHGARIAESVPLSDEVDVTGRWRPELPDGRPTYAVRYHAAQSARRLLHVDPREARPVVEVSDGDRDYDAVVDLLGSGPDAAEFVVESEEDGTAVLRFGDGTYGRRPDPDIPHTATYRHGHGSIGNVGPESVVRLRPTDAGFASVRNPLPATGGTDPEPIDKVRTDAPHAFRVQERAVTEDDYGTLVADRVPDVQRAAGRMRWTGSWYTAFVTVDRIGGLQVDPGFAADVRTFLDGYRMAGVDVEVSRPRPVALDIELEICARPDRFNTDVERDVLDVVSARVLPDGRRGLFHPDHFTFGTPVYLSRLYAAVLEVPGVVTVRATKFRRFGESDRGELAAGILRVHDLEIAQLANDPDVPERGVLHVSVGGGR